MVNMPESSRSTITNLREPRPLVLASVGGVAGLTTDDAWENMILPFTPGEQRSFAALRMTAAWLSSCHSSNTSDDRSLHRSSPRPPSVILSAAKDLRWVQ